MLPYYTVFMSLIADRSSASTIIMTDGLYP